MACVRHGLLQLLLVDLPDLARGAQRDHVGQIGGQELAAFNSFSLISFFAVASRKARRTAGLAR